MPRYQSIGGRWYPAKERHNYSQDEMISLGLDPTKDTPFYEGPDRAATEELRAKELEYLGMDCRMQEETMVKARQLGCETIDEYLKKYKNVDLDNMEKKQKEYLSQKIHLDEERIVRKQAVSPPSGGDDTSGNNKSKKGGFGEPTGISLPGIKTGPGESPIKK